ncbi:hypothetical protein D3C85_595650 [compost metagenome]
MIWTQRSATPNRASDTATLVIELSVVPRAPVSSTPAHQSIISSACFSAIRLSASMKPTPSWSISGLPKAWRLTA